MSGQMTDDELMRSDWERIVDLHKSPLGKSTVVPFQFSAGSNPHILSNLEIRGNDDTNAMQFSLTFSPPRMREVGVFPADPQNDQGPFYDNDAILSVGNARWDNPFALVEWGVGGINQKVDCDILNGLVLNLTASYCRVVVGAGEVNVDLGSKLYQLQCCIGPGRPKSVNAQKTKSFNTFAANLAPIVPTPFFAKQVSVMGNANGFGTTASGELMFFRDSAGAQPIGHLVWTDSKPGPFPIPNGGFYFRIKRDAPAQPISPINAVFELAV